MRASKARRLRALIEAASDKGLSDKEALEGVELFPQWDGEAAYQKDQRVRYEGTLYRCLQDHTAQPGWTPTAAPSLWARVLIEDPDVVPEWVQPGPANGYMLGDRVMYQGKVWCSLADNNIWVPGEFGWEECA